MSDTSAKTTIYLDPKVKKFLQHKSIEENSSMSEIINNYFADMLLDLEDIKTIQQRRTEESISFDDVLAEAGITYNDLRS